MQVNHKYAMEGLFRLVVRKVDDNSVSKDTGWFENLITNSGMDAIAAGGVLNGATVGTGTTPESVTDVALVGYLARTSNYAPGGQAALSVGSNVAPYYQKAVATWRFPVGAATGNLSEVGIIHTYTAAAAYPLWSRTLIRDSAGNPITITVLADEYLDVMYEARVYPQDVIGGGTVDLMGNTYSYRVGGKDINTSDYAYIFTYGIAYRNSPYVTAYAGPLSASPANSGTGTNLNPGGGGDIAKYAYTQGNYSIDIAFKLPAGTATGAIRSINMSIFGVAYGPEYAVEFTPAFTKSATVELNSILTIGWARRP